MATTSACWPRWVGARAGLAGQLLATWGAARSSRQPAARRQRGAPQHTPQGPARRGADACRRTTPHAQVGSFRWLLSPEVPTLKADSHVYTFAQADAPSK